MAAPCIVLDTNVLVAALRSSLGASYKVLSEVGTGRFDISISVPLVLEYEDALKRQIVDLPHLNERDVDDLLDFLCRVGQRQHVFYLWRPALRDPNDDLVLELGVAARSDAIVTHNLRDFRGADQFGIEVVSPREFLAQLEMRT